MKRCLIVDTETTSLDPQSGAMIEVAAVLYSIESNTVLQSVATLLPGEMNEAERINRIPVSALKEMHPINSLMTTIQSLAVVADCIVAYNAEFDEKWLRGKLAQRPWVCAAFDFAWPAASRDVGSLVGLALDHGIGVGSAHRALTDCMLVAELFSRMPLFGCDLREMFARAMRPKAMFQALVPFEQKDLAKNAGFKWEPTPKRWVRRMAIEDAALLPFRTLQLPPS